MGPTPMNKFHLSRVLIALTLCAPVSTCALTPVKNELKLKGSYILVGEAAVRPVIVKATTPHYPSSLRLYSELVGEVEVVFIINEKGIPEEVQAVSANDIEFAKAALEAVRQWRFKPGMKDGKPARVLVLQKVMFQIGA